VKVDVVARFTHIWKTGVVVTALLATVVACGNSDASRARNVALVAGTTCTKPGQISKISKVAVVCGKTKTGNIWYPTMKSNGRSVSCIKSGAVRKKKSVVWVCGVAKGKKLWFATSPLPPAVLQATAVVAPGVVEPVPVLESTEVATPSRPVVADNNVLANPTIADEAPVTAPVTIATVPSAPVTIATIPSAPPIASVPSTPVLGAALTPTLGSPTATADGFTVQISNYDQSYTWAGRATASGEVSIDNTGFVTVTGVAAATSSTATITTTKQNTVDGANTVTAISLTCATGGICKARDIGPGGGIVFYDAGATQSWGRYLEAAITATSSWTPGTAATPGTKAQWGCNGTSVPGTSIEIGTGQANTKIITDAKCVGTDGSLSAASIAKAYNGGGKADWFLPSRKELNALCLEFFNDPNSKYIKWGWWSTAQLDGCMGRESVMTGATNGISWFFDYRYYQSSSEAATNQYFGNGGQQNGGKTGNFHVRPVRAF